MKPSMTFNYSVIRFLPYPESGEFVNVGVVVSSPQTGFFDFRIERRKFRRIANFFPELHSEVYREGIYACAEEIGRMKAEIGINCKNAWQTAINPSFTTGFFRELIRPRETIIRYSEPGTVMTHEPEAVLNELFAHYVERMFAKEQDYQEEIMRKRVLEVLRTHKLLGKFKQEVRVGNEEYGFKLPFVTEPRIGFFERAIKPLNLSQDDSTKIYDHGEMWVNRIKRLQRMNLAPRDLLFTVNEPPTASRRHGAFSEVVAELEAQGTKVVRATDEKVIVDFASQED